jgi:hypothetical protein
LSELARTLIPPEYPSELLWNGRLPDQNFAPDELLYYRVPKFDDRGKVSVQDVAPCPDTSVNRGKYSRPEHVLFARYPLYLRQQVAQFHVSDIPEYLLSGIGERIRFVIEHDPVRPPEEQYENYSHSEIRAFNGTVRAKKVSPKVQKEFRQIISELMKPVPRPDA